MLASFSLLQVDRSRYIKRVLYIHTYLKEPILSADNSSSTSELNEDLSKSQLQWQAADSASSRPGFTFKVSLNSLNFFKTGKKKKKMRTTWSIFNLPQLAKIIPAILQTPEDPGGL